MTPDQKKLFKTRAHALKPVVWLGHHRLTPAVLAEINIALEAHELIKIKIPGVERAERNLIVTQIVTATAAELVQVVGQIATVYRKRQHVPTSPAKTTTKKR